MLLGERMSLLGDQRRALGRIENDLVRLEALDVVGHARDLEGFVAVEAVPPRLAASLDLLDGERHDLAVEHADDGMQRAYPMRTPGAPTHGLGPGEFGRRGRHYLAHDFLRGPSRLVNPHDVEVTLLLVLDDLRRLDRLEPRRLEEASDGLRRRVDPRALALLAEVGRLGRHVVDHERYPAGRREGPGRAGDEPLGR